MTKQRRRRMKKNTIYEEDCIAFMQHIPKKSVDVIVTSPPYNLKKNYSKYKDNKLRDDYIAWMGDVAEKSKEILKDNGSFFLNIVGAPTDQWISFDVARVFGKHFKLQNTIHWIKSIAIPKESAKTKSNGLNGDISIGHFKPINTPRYFNQCHEYIFHFTKEGDVALDKIAIGVPYQHASNLTRWKTKNDKRDRGNVWFIRYDNKQGAFYPEVHPAIFPEKLPYLCIKAHGIKEGLLVYDPFMGVGNTALASMRLGVDYIGTDVDNRYIKEAEKAIKQQKKVLAQQELNH